MRTPKTWWEIFTKGINPERKCTHTNSLTQYQPWILRVICRRQIPWIPCQGPEVEAIYPGAEVNVPLKSTTAAEKMEHPAALSNRVGRGGRDVQKWGKTSYPALEGKRPLKSKG